jgi:hypothetical protein
MRRENPEALMQISHMINTAQEDFIVNVIEAASIKLLIKWKQALL